MQYAESCFVGLGGAGISIVQNVDPDRVDNRSILLLNTDAFVEHFNRIYPRIVIGANRLQGEGAGRDPAKGRLAVDESWPEILESIKRFKNIIIVAGAAGGTGGAAPYLAERLLRIGKSVSICLSSAFSLESSGCRKIAAKTIAEAEANSRLTRQYIFSPDEEIVKWKRLPFIEYLNLYGKRIMDELVNDLSIPA